MSGRPITVAKTSGGIPVVVDEIPDSQSASYMIGVATGSRDETPEIFGLSHLLEHTVFRETKTMDSYQMSKEIEGAGGELNAFTGREMTAFYGITIKETADVARRIVGDIVANPLINENSTELEKKIVLQELSMVKNDPESYIHDLFSMHLWRGHELCQDEGGDENIVANLTYKDLRAYYEEKYLIPNLSVYAVGATDVDETVAWAEETLDGMSGGKRNVRKDPPTPEGSY
jgi:predicted Zn-dependent peptidase